MLELSFCAKLDKLLNFASIVSDNNQSHKCLQSACDIVSHDWRLKGKRCSRITWYKNEIQNGGTG